MSVYPEIERILSERVGWDVQAIGVRNLKRVVESRMGPNGRLAYGAYWRRLLDDSFEFARLVEALAVPETWFFRDREAFTCLERSEHLRGRTWLRVLSAPCSTGEEPVSIAITLLKAGLSAGSFQVDAVDVNAAALSVAKKGWYSRSSFRQHVTDFQARHFEEREGGFVVSRTVLQRLRFLEGNLASPGVLENVEPYDIVFCKNLIIYLTQEARSKLVSNLDRLLKPDGMLFVGHSEVPLLHKCGYTPIAFPRAFALTRGNVPRPTSRPEKSKPRRPASLSEGMSLRLKTAHPLAAPPVRTSAPQSEESPIDRVQRLADGGALEEAAAACGKLMEANPSDPRVYYLAGLIEQASNRLEAAEELFRKAIYLAPDDDASLVQMSLLLERKGDARRAAQYRNRLRRLQERERV